MPSLLAGIAALLITTVSIVVTVLALDNATGGTLSPKMPAVYDLITSLPNARFTGYLNRVVDVYTLIRWALIAGCGLVTSLLEVCLTGFRDRVEQFYTFLRWASITVYGLTTPILKACLAGFLARMEEFYTLLQWSFVPALIGSIIWAIPATKWEALGNAVSVSLQVVFNFIQDRSNFRREAIDMILAMQERLDLFENGTILSAKVKEDFVTKEDAKAQADALQATITHGANQLKEANSMIDYVEKHNKELQDDLEDMQKSHTHKEQLRREEEHKDEIARYKHLVQDQEDMIKSEKSKVQAWKYECDKLESSLQVVRQQDDKIEELENKVQTLDQVKESLSEENRNLRATVFPNERKAAKLNEMTELIHEMSTSSVMWHRLAVTIFGGSMADRGLNLAEFGIDQARFQTYLQWASDMISNKTSAFNPTEGFRGPVLLLTGGGEDASQVGTS
jgi:Trp operon repressor